MTKLLTTNKHFFVLMCMAAMLCMSQVANAAKYECTTFLEFEAALEDHTTKSDTILLANDLTGSKLNPWFVTPSAKEAGESYESDIDTFCGVIDGQGHTISYWVLQGYLFKDFRGAIKNLILDGCVAAASKDRAGVNTFFAHQCNNAVFENIKFIGSGAARPFTDLSDEPITLENITKVTYTVMASLFVGVATDTKFYNCTADCCSVGWIVGDAKEDGLMGEAAMFANFLTGSCTIANCNVIDALIAGESNVGGIVGSISTKSDFCEISNCTVSGGIEGKFSAGGIADMISSNTYIHDCINYADVKSSGKEVGGIVGRQLGGKIHKCSNYGYIHHDPTLTGVIVEPFIPSHGGNYGGIAGYSEGEIKCCKNNGGVKYGKTDCGGIVGTLSGSAGKVIGCANYAPVKATKVAGGIVGKISDGASLIYCLNLGDVEGSTAADIDGERSGGNVLYCYNVDNFAVDLSYYQFIVEFDYYEINSAFLRSGKFACFVNKLSGEELYGQRMNPDGSYIDEYPFPGGPAVYMHDAYSNCENDNTTEYFNNNNSNHYGSIAVDNSGTVVCTYCGKGVDIDETNSYDIYTAEDLVSFSTVIVPVCPRANAILRADIDCSSITLWTPIGNSNVTYQGIFDGNNHRIKNLVISSTETTDNSVGLFGYLGNGALIRNLIIDSSCSINTRAYGVAGIAGCVSSTSGETCKVTIVDCGNEASVAGKVNVAGILGGVYYNDNTVVTIKNCYNTGDITGTRESAAICGFARKNYDIENCWNTGTVAGNTSDMYLVRHTVEGTRTFTNNYSSTGTQTGVTSFSKDDVGSGKLCWLLNGSEDGSNKSGWYQNMSSDKDSRPKWIAVARDVIYKHMTGYCNEAEGTVEVYTNDDNEIAAKHIYDDDGYCTLTTGETHYQEPMLVGKKYYLSTPGNLYWIAENVNKGNGSYNCVLVNDIVVNKDLVADGSAASFTADNSNMREWIPIGTAEHPYTNYTFDGQGHTISGLYLQSNTTQCIGLFGVANNYAEIKNLGVINSYFGNKTTSTDNYVGLIVGCGSSVDRTNTNGAVIRNCYSSGNINCGKYIGGIAGYLNCGTDYIDRLANVYSTCAFMCGSEHNAGVLFGGLGTTDGATYKGPLNSTLYYISNPLCRVTYGTSCTEKEFKFGTVANLLNSGTNNYTPEYSWQQNIGSDDIPKFGIGGALHQRFVPNNYKWGTVMVPFTLTSDDNIQYYAISNIGSDDDAKLYLKAVDTVEPNTPCFYCRLNVEVSSGEDYLGQNSYGVGLNFCNTEDDLTLPESIQFTKTVSLPNDGSLDFIGTYEDIANVKCSSKNNAYYLANDKMWRGDNSFTVPALRAYIRQQKQSSTSSAKSLTLCIANGDEMTSIGEISSDGKVKFYDSPIYNVNGQRMSSTQKGQINIVNGKKILVK